MERKAIFFDLDGTLWDASVPVGEAWTIVGKRRFGDFYECSASKARSQMGLTMDVIARNLTPKGENDETMNSFAKEAFAYENDYLYDHPGRLYQNEEAVLGKLKEMGYELYVLSNCQLGYIEVYLHCLKHPEVFSGKLCFGDTGLPKSGSIRVLMDKIGNPRTIYVGDTGKDESETHQAGIPFLHASYGFGEAEKPEGVLKSFEEILNVAPKLFECVWKTENEG